MLDRLILAAPAGATRERMEAFFASRVKRLLVLKREEAVREGRLVIEDEEARWDGEALLGVPAAVVLDSGFMWPVPRLAPDAETWEAFHDRFDEYLRDERESASLWLSLMEILSDRLWRVINPQAAFAHAALKPAALDRLRAAGVATVPQLDTNDPDEVLAFAEAHPRPGALLWLPAGDLPGPARWVEWEERGEREEREEREGALAHEERAGRAGTEEREEALAHEERAGRAGTEGTAERAGRAGTAGREGAEERAGTEERAGRAGTEGTAERAGRAGTAGREGAEERAGTEERVGRDELLRSLSQEPVCLQAPLDREARRVVVVDGAPLLVDGGMDLSGLAPDMAAALSTVCQRLELGFGEVTFRRTAQGFAVSDFDPAPDVGAWAPDAAEVALEGLWQALVGSVAGKLQQLVRERRAQRKGGGGPHRGSGPDRGEDSGSAAGHGSGAGGSESAG